MKKSVLIGLIAAFSLSVVAFAEEAPSAPATAPSSPQSQASPEVKVIKVAVGTAIDNRELVGEAKEFDTSITRLYCWTKVSATSVPTQIKHVWSLNGQKQAEVALDIKYDPSRTWSSKVVSPGTWKVDVEDASGKSLGSEEVTIKEGAAKAPASEKPAAAEPETKE